MDIATIQGAIGSLKVVADIAKSIIEAKSIADAQGKVIELQSAILAAQRSALAAQSEYSAAIEVISTLKKEIADIKAWETQKQRYKLVKPWSSGVAYALKKSMSNSEPPHLICTNCYEGGRKSILNPAKDTHSFVSYVCPVCNSQVPTGYRGSPEPEYATD